MACDIKQSTETEKKWNSNTSMGSLKARVLAGEVTGRKMKIMWKMPCFKDKRNLCWKPRKKKSHYNWHTAEFPIQLGDMYPSVFNHQIPCTLYSTNIFRCQLDLHPSSWPLRQSLYGKVLMENLVDWKHKQLKQKFEYPNPTSSKPNKTNWKLATVSAPPHRRCVDAALQSRHSFAGKMILGGGFFQKKNAFQQYRWHFQQRALLTWLELISSANITSAQLFAASIIPETSPKHIQHTMAHKTDYSRILYHRKNPPPNPAYFLKIKRRYEWF